MSSLRKIDSARANGAKSHGPITEEGRKKSSMNAFKHGLNARTPVLFNETDDEHAALLDSYVQDFQPVGPAEMAAVIDMVDAKWRQRRLLNIESQMFELQLLEKKRSSTQPANRTMRSLRTPSRSGSLQNREAWRW